jgi:SAM-dependent methyltransferase
VTASSAWRCPACDATAAAPRFARGAPATGSVDAESFVPSSDRFGSTVGALLRCLRCGHASLAERPEQEVFEGAYLDAADETSLREEEGQVATASRDLARLERVVAPGRLLDIGSWTGSLLVAAARRGWTADGLEPSAWASSRAAERGCDVRQAVLDDVTLADGSYRAVVAADVIEHLVDPASALATIAAALEDGGGLLLTVPDAGSSVARVLGRRWWSVLPMHVQYFTRASMTALLERTGFVVDEIATHAKAFSWEYYAERLEAFLPVGGRVAPAMIRRLGLTDRVVAPDFRDRMIVVARKAGDQSTSGEP